MDSEPSMIPISRNVHHKGGRYCIFKGCFEARKSYNTLRDHLFFHWAFRAQMKALDVNYQNCCESQPTFMNDNQKMLHRFKHCKNAPINLSHIMSKVADKTEEYIYDDESSETDAPPSSPSEI